MAPGTRAERFLALHKQPQAFVIPNPWDLGSARILEAIGYQALATSSQGFAFTRGYRDGHVERDLMLEHCADLVSAVAVPVSADLEDGYGDTPAQVADTYRLAATVGLAGASIEDYSGGKLLETAAAVERIEAAMDGIEASGKGFVLTARAEGFLRGAPNLADVIERLNRYAEAGAQVLYAPGLPDLGALTTLCAEVNLPVNALVVGAFTHSTVAELTQAGASRLSLGSMFSHLVFTKLVKAATETHTLGSFGWAAEIGADPEIGALVHATMRERES